MHSRLYIAFHLQWILASFLEQSLHQIRPDISLDELGADSFDLMELQAIMEETFGIFIAEPLRTYTTFAELVELVYTTMANPPAPPH
ncbi:acyl carrier protein [Pseudomonas sp. TE6288]|uniref:acyl carrier protein n=1 Tax=Pseudomonas TaxID=286 RepID=UPI000C87DD44|nr:MULTISPECIES: acyl carrier protein [Pseudomonas]MBI6955663.1 acyl carrier protein [Pseudomonas sp. CCOS 191]MDF9756105.1 acyl carrier protein [Pseudomonas hunanensis]PMZ93253.1 acyl carrier protein [Pseudomonas sp. FW305-42]PNA27255.1 acyl carrier protein [Pseudomonas sp. MPR-R1B]PNB26967.1 acyl carrier protein [Pseudomonas sp. DP16D-E2]